MTGVYTHICGKRVCAKRSCCHSLALDQPSYTNAHAGKHTLSIMSLLHLSIPEHASYHAGRTKLLTGKELTEKAPQVGITAGSPASQCQGPQDCQLPPQPPSPHSRTPATPLPLLDWAVALLIQPEHTAACQHWMGHWLMGHWSWFRSCWMIWRISRCVSVSRRMSGWWWWRCRCCGCWCFCGALRCCELCCCQGGICQETETCVEKARLRC